MSFEKPNAEVEKKDISEKDLGKDLANLESGLQRILNGKDVNYAEEMKKIEEHLAVMNKKYEGKEKVINFIREVSPYAAAGAGVGALLGVLLGDMRMASLGFGGASSLLYLSETATGPTKIKAQELRKTRLSAAKFDIKREIDYNGYNEWVIVSSER